MPKINPHNRSVFFASQTGCFLPLLIGFNLFFGWIFFKPLVWLLIEVFLILLFILNAQIVMRKIFSTTSKHDNAIDVEGEVVEDKKRIK